MNRTLGTAPDETNILSSDIKTKGEAELDFAAFDLALKSRFQTQFGNEVF
jgi:hypothetical protein